MGAMSELHIQMQREYSFLSPELNFHFQEREYLNSQLIYEENMNEELICEHCNWPIDPDDILEIKHGLFIHASCEIEYYSGLK